MELTIQIPRLSRMRRMAIGLSLVLVLVALALPASAAPPDGIEGEVTVVNEPTNPVPITGDVTADVTGSVNVAGTVTVGNEATDPVPVTGTVGLAASESADLDSIATATSALTVDGASNLNVNVAAGSVAASPVTSTAALFGTQFAALDHISAADDMVYTNDGVDAHMTVLSVKSIRGGLIVFVKRDDAVLLHFLVASGDDEAFTFSSPILADTVLILCNESTIGCDLSPSAVGY